MNMEAPDSNAELAAESLEHRLFIALAGGTLLLVSWVAGIFGLHPQVVQIPAFLGALVLAAPLLQGAVNELRSGQASSESLASLAVLAAIATGNYLAAGFLAFFLKAANLILSRTAWGAQRAIRELVRLTPDLARVVEPGGQEVEKRLGELSVGSIVRVRPGEN